MYPWQLGKQNLAVTLLLVALTRSDNGGVADDEWQAPTVLLTVDLVILTLRGTSLQLLLVERGVEPYAGSLALPGGFLRDAQEPIEVAARRELTEETGLDADSLLLEQLGVYGDPDRDPRGRVVSVAYLAIAPRLPDPVASTDAAAARWTPVSKVLTASLPLAFDHLRIVADGVERARSKLEYSAIATAFCGPTFTISELQQVYEAVWDVRLDPRNFYRKIQGTRDFVIPAASDKRAGVGRPARLFRAGPGKVLYPPMVRPANPLSPSTGQPREGKVMSEQKTVVILTALDLEYESVREKLTNLEVHAHRAGTRFEVGRLMGHDCRVALAQVGKGNHAAAVLAERAISEFDPMALLFVGVAGALRPSLALGDVVVATHVYAYHGGTSLDDGLKSRPRVWEVSHRVQQIAQHLKRTGEWTRFLPPNSEPSNVVFGPIAAGEIVQDSAISAEAQWIREHYNDACAIEMESAGVAQAAQLNDSRPLVVVRGISDRADGEKVAADGAGWQPRAAANATAFAIALVAALAEELDDRRSVRHSDDTGHGGRTNSNIAKENARVGVQAQNIYGGVWLGPDHGNGQAGFVVTDHHASSSGKLRKALAWLRGVLSDAASLATGLATVMTAVRSLT
jgi:nucleoside phosphorylase/ADP-ribose pyrophosphatase YjhB (NUDIX family)